MGLAREQWICIDFVALARSAGSSSRCRGAPARPTDQARAAEPRPSVGGSRAGPPRQTWAARSKRSRRARWRPATSTISRSRRFGGGLCRDVSGRPPSAVFSASSQVSANGFS
eukprot:8984016-Pyramimonas_sp.AAC.1